MFNCVIPATAKQMSAFGYVLRNVAYRVDCRMPDGLADLLDKLERRRSTGRGRTAR